MRNKISVTILIVCYCFGSNTIVAQTKQKSEAAFLKQLNNILLNSNDQNWAYRSPLTVDSAFAINNEGVLSLTIHYKVDDSGIVIRRMESPIKKILRVGFDRYLVLEYKENEITVFESELNSKALKESYKTNLFHIGAPLTDGYQLKEKLQKLLNEVLKF